MNRTGFAIALITTLAIAQSPIATGRWAWRGKTENYGELRTIQVGKRVKFQLVCSCGAPSYNSGFIEGEFDLLANKGTFRTTEFGDCEISFEFLPKKVIIRQPDAKMDCGFGHAVYPAGDYALKSKKPPHFWAGDPRTAE